MMNRLLLVIVIGTFVLISSSESKAEDAQRIKKSSIQEKEKVDFGGMIKETAAEVKSAEKTLKKTIKPQQLRRKKPQKPGERVKLVAPPETIEAKDNMQWDHNKQNAEKLKNNIENQQNTVIESESKSN